MEAICIKYNMDDFEDVLCCFFKLVIIFSF